MTHINQRRDLSANWASANPVLQDGEVGWETDTRRSKLGDGVTAWNDLGYSVSTLAVTKADVGLDQVDNTADMDKPISTATQAALDTKADAGAVSTALSGKAPLDSPVLTGTPTAPTPAAGDNDTSIATTAFVHGEVVDGITNIAAPDVQIFTAGGTWNKPAGAKTVVVEVVGGGGQGGGAGAAASGAHANGGGGGAGAYAKKQIAASSIGASVAVTIGAGGSSGGAGAAGANGASSSFGTIAVAGGGSGGALGGSSTATFGVAGGAGGAPSAGDLQVPGESGGYGFGGGSLGAGGKGGSTRFGAGGAGGISSAAGVSSNGGAGSGRGAGGGGALSTSTGAAAAGGAGAGGIVVVTTYFA